MLGVIDYNLSRSTSGNTIGTTNTEPRLWEEIAVGVCEIHGLPWMVACLSESSATGTVSNDDSRCIIHVISRPFHGGESEQLLLVQTHSSEEHVCQAFDPGCNDTKGKGCGEE